jgi:hypothetical protein
MRLFPSDLVLYEYIPRRRARSASKNRKRETVDVSARQINSNRDR